MIVKKLASSLCQDANLLKESKTYIVYAILFDEDVKFLVEDEDVFSFPFFVSAKEVEIIDNKVSSYWKYSNPLTRTPKSSSRSAMLACEEMLERFFYQTLVDGELSSKRKWELLKERLDKEFD
ncbi:hypothetical protein [Pseudidiomarina terrestris]|uniref:Uncharacterized protein n=1 Tax=Pseudidiomarina terrestris TaxID=2820060 RepID=A0AAW7QYS4_9GAMM|nr:MULTISPECIES: hypothetical protein [unclassified Pseudidiomarina]MDN7125375.1 hypothetical protein [Pseudidiomarina sp. 1APP75-32.1]MDN7127979.1 hypothetical protein [Pseudidiomarina sp. 1APR75-33.1]MDN7130133.1 hypothetical protein [Pseudidiomarina sp. 1APR75-15]MDN7135638.1 hypothetical protein [Pseudidiomarina sp. 1ASP75-5]MDN7137324.1 hypothetical protein [Pseudidiomarina sp. 1ASP75-14]